MVGDLNGNSAGSGPSCEVLGAGLVDPWNGIPEEYRNQVVTGDARELAAALPDGSVDLVFTDPVYEQVDDYGWLAETALRVLKPNRSVLAWTSKPLARPCQHAMEQAGLKFVYWFDYVVPAKTYCLHAYRVFCWSTPCLWFVKGHHRPEKWLPDTLISHGNTAGAHKWNKNPEAFTRLLDAFTRTGDIVWDPFTGGGTLPVVCKSFGRNFVASEIDSATAEAARARIANTTPPLFVLDPPDPQLLLADLAEGGPEATDR